MSNPFRRHDPDQSFPRPEWPPIQDLDRINVTGKRRDGGVDLFIVASQPVDVSEETLESIRRKVNTYLMALRSEEFWAELGHPPPDRTRIIIACEHPIHPAAMSVIDECAALAAGRGVRLEVQRPPA